MLPCMDFSSILSAIDEKIATLQQAKSLLSSTAVPATERLAKEAAAKISPKATKQPAKKTGKPGRKPMSEEGRARIAEAQKKRWAAKNTASTTGPKAAKKVAAASKKAGAKKTAAVKPYTGKKRGPKPKNTAQETAPVETPSS